jgi:hypothetical protein
MNRPPRRPPPPRSASSPGARLFDRSDGGPLLLVGVGAALLVIVLWILFLPPFSLLRGNSSCQAAGDGYKVCATNAVPAPPAGLAPASRYYNDIAFNKKNGVGNTVSISLPLSDPKGTNQGLSFYSYQGGKWSQLAPASISADGISAEGQIQGLPNNLIVFRRQTGALEVMGALPAGKAILNADAAKLLTTLNPSGFSIGTDGSISGEAAPIAPGAQYQVIPAVQATSGAAATAVSQILATPDRQSAHVAQLVQLAGRPGYNGVELDYTALSGSDQRQNFTNLVSALALQLHKTQHLLGLELPAPTLTANGWNSGAYDWGTLAKSADYLKLLPDPDQSVYRKQMPDLLKYLTAQAGVDPRKIILVTSAYSAEKSDQGVTPRTRVQALSIASAITIQNPDQAAAGTTITLAATNLSHDAGASGLTWDGTTATVSYDYRVGGATHVVWIENQYSEGFKLQYVQIYRLGGVAVDDASNDATLGDPWPAIAEYVSTGAPLLQQPNPALLLPVWQVDGNPLDSGGQTSVSWPAPAQPGPHTVSLIVGDGVVRVIGSTTLTLRSGPLPSATPVAGGIVIASATPRPPPPTAAPVQRQFGASATPTIGR